MGLEDGNIIKVLRKNIKVSSKSVDST